MVRETEVVPTAADNFAVARFMAWTQVPWEAVRGVIVMVPGSNQDGRTWATLKGWQNFATKHKLCLVGCCLQDRQPSWVEQYIDVKNGSGVAFLSALDQLGLAGLPLYLWGFSAGGEFNYELACWLAPQKPGLIKAFIVNKGGVYMTLLAPQQTRETPALFFIGNWDARWRQDTIHAIYSLNTVAGALWSERVENCNHEIKDSEHFSMKLFEQILGR